MSPPDVPPSEDIPKIEVAPTTPTPSRHQDIQMAVSPASTVGTTGGNTGHMRPLSGQKKVVNNPMPHRLPEGENAAPLEVIGTTASDKLVIIMVGLPATGT
jgi:hypothetical protein